MRTLSLSTRAGRVLVGLLAALAMALLAAAWAPSPADAELISAFDASSSTQAGAYADVTTSFKVGGAPLAPDREMPKRMEFDLPAGLLGTISSFPTCDLGRVMAGTCPAATQVGEGTATLTPNPFGSDPAQVYNLPPAGKDVATLAFRLTFFGMTLAVVPIHLQVRPDDYGLKATINTLPGLTLKSSMTLWGYPFAHTGENEGKTFMANPFVCGQPETTTLRVTSVQDPDKLETYTSTAPELTGCDQLSFARRSGRGATTRR